MDKGSASLLVLVDRSAAFNIIDHGVLLGRLAGLGIGGTVLGIGGTMLRWFRSFLADRSQKVVLGMLVRHPGLFSVGCHKVPFYPPCYLTST